MSPVWQGLVRRLVRLPWKRPCCPPGFEPFLWAAPLRMHRPHLLLPLLPLLCMLLQNIVVYLVKMLDRSNVELLILATTFLKKLSIYKVRRGRGGGRQGQGVGAGGVGICAGCNTCACGTWAAEGEAWPCCCMTA